ncbi:MAG: FixH family protein, partial [Rickettsiales bacterium]
NIHQGEPDPPLNQTINWPKNFDDGQFIRPTHEGHDFSGALAPLGNGRYAAEFDVPLAGQWDVRVAANRGDNRYYKQDRVDLR